jgi:hydrogenase expression/formation protein HypC
MSIEREHCLTCGDVAVAARVVEVEGSTALVEAEGGREQVAIELVEPVVPGQLLLCHAGIAIDKLE